MSDKPTIPRTAASLILVRGEADNLSVLMGRRHATARFMPGVYVFPGGAVDDDDNKVTPASGLDPKITDSLKVAGNHQRAHALAIAAVRETYEETGLMLGAPGNVGAAQSDSWISWRQQSIAPDLLRLGLVGRAITPKRFPIRFNARFFIASGESLYGEIRSNGELEAIGWKPVSELAHLPMPDVQAFMIKQVQLTLQGRLTRSGTPLFSHRQGKPYIRYQ